MQQPTYLTYPTYICEFKYNVYVAKTHDDIANAIKDFLDGFDYSCGDKNKCVQMYFKILSTSDLFTNFLANRIKFNDAFFNKLYEFAKITDIDNSKIYQEYINIFCQRLDNFTKT
jgi:hypothetical protein